MIDWNFRLSLANRQADIVYAEQSEMELSQKIHKSIMKTRKATNGPFKLVSQFALFFHFSLFLVFFIFSS